MKGPKYRVVEFFAGELVGYTRFSQELQTAGRLIVTIYVKNFAPFLGALSLGIVKIIPRDSAS